MTTLERINQRATQVDARKAILTLLMFLPFALGWLTRKAVLAVAWSGAWLWAAAAEGWTAAGGKTEAEPPWAR